MKDFFLSFLTVINEMSPFLLLGFLIAGILHVFVPKKFYSRYLSRDNKLSVVWAALLVVTGTATDDDIRKAVEQAGFEYKGRKK